MPWKHTDSSGSASVAVPVRRRLLPRSLVPAVLLALPLALGAVVYLCLVRLTLTELEDLALHSRPFQVVAAVVIFAGCVLAEYHLTKDQPPPNLFWARLWKREEEDAEEPQKG